MATASLRQDILDAALAEFTERGYERATIADIRARAGVSNGAVFHHFKSKEAIAEALYLAGIASFQAGLAAILDRRPENVAAAIRAAVAHHLNWNETHRDLAFFMYNRGRPDWTPSNAERIEQLNRDSAARIRAWLAPFIASGEIRRVSTTVLAACVVGPTHFVAQRWLAGLVKAPPTAFAEELGDAACAALLLKPARRAAASRMTAPRISERLPTPKDLSGVELLQRMKTGEIALPLALATMGARLVSIEAERLTLTLPPAADRLDGAGAVMALLAAAAELALLIVLPRDKTTAAHQITSALPVRPASNAIALRIEAAVAPDSGQAVTVEALLAADERILGRATMSALIVDRTAHQPQAKRAKHHASKGDRT